MTLSPLVVPRAADEPIHRIRVGAVEVFPIVQLHYRVDPSLFFPDIAAWPTDPAAWYLREPYLVDGRIAVDMGGFVVRTADRTILVDAGVGNDKVRPNPNFDHRGDDWLAALARTGIAPDDVDTVVFTHLHIDHVGFATTRRDGRWVPTFPQAAHLVTQTELDFWTSDASRRQLERLGDYMSDSVQPLADAGVLAIVEPDHVIADGIRLFAAPGHTPGNVCLEILSEGHRAVFAGDMVHHALQLAFPDRSTDYCVDEHLATASRRLLLESLAPDDLLFPAHFPGSLPGRVAADGRGGFTFEVVAGEPI
jgi:glyoxylase-like metal-dependent hydrolase (beta-lactamase superfamily II)